MSARRELGQYFTPPEAVDFCVRSALRALGRRAESVIDPACGDGAFIERLVELRAARAVHGLEIDPSHAASAAHRCPKAKVQVADALAGPAAETHDLVVGNPPYGGGRGEGRLELRFVRRFVDLTAQGGAGALVLPVGFFSNATSAGLRNELLRSIHPLSVVELPPKAFASVGAAARTCVLVYRKTPPAQGAECAFLPWPGGEGWGYLEGDAAQRIGKPVRIETLAGGRWDPAYIVARLGASASSRAPLQPIGELLAHLTYGAIVTGEAARSDPGGTVALVGLRQIRETGIDIRGARRVSEDGLHDPPRCRLKRGDIVFARSGVGSLLKGRVAVYGGPFPATVGCFVDLLRPRGIEPGYLALCLRSQPVRDQVERLANGVAAPNLNFAEIRSLLVPRLGAKTEGRLAAMERESRRLHASALRRGRDPAEARALIARATQALERAFFA